MFLRKNADSLFYLPIILILIAGSAVAATAQKHTQDGDTILGFGILSRLPGLWNGPVSTTTPAGSFDNWYVDFRPVSPGQVSQYSTLDAQTLNYLSFFIVEHDNRLKISMHTEGVFEHMSESIYFTFENDPNSSSSQPFVGNVTVNIAIGKDLNVERDHELFLLLTTESLFEGLKYKKENLKYISKYVYLPVGTESYTFNNVHPGRYFLYSYNDINGDKRHLSGDYMSSDLNNVFTLQAKGNVEVDTTIDFLIP